MNKIRRYLIPMLTVLLLAFGAGHLGAEIFVQCPTEDTNPTVDTDGDGNPANDFKCVHLSAGDGYVKMADGTDMYTFSFAEVPIPYDPLTVVADFTRKAENPAPTITLKQGQELFLTLTNVGMQNRPDLFDAHSVHWHGFPNAAVVFDGVPENSITPKMGVSLTYYYYAAVPGTYFYHCHVEAAEHMQMGMIGNLWVEPSQNGTPIGGFDKFAYNDGDGTTGYDVEYPLQLTGFDSAFHNASEAVQTLPFAAMYDDYTMVNGRGYPMTMNPDPINNKEGNPSQKVNAIIEAASGQRVLLRVSNVSTTHLYAITTTLGKPMRVVGRGAALLRGPDGDDTSYEVSVLNVAGGQAFDVLLDLAGVAPGTYFLYSTNLSVLANGPEERGGLMTEIIVN